MSERVVINISNHSSQVARPTNRQLTRSSIRISSQRERPKRVLTRKNRRTNQNNTNNNNNNNNDINVNMGQSVSSVALDLTMPRQLEELSEEATNENNTISDSNQTQNTNNGINTNTNSDREVSQMCIDLTEDESIVDENSVESDSEIQCISSFIRNPPDVELAIIRETNLNRRRTNTRDRSRSPIVRREQNDEIIEITNSRSVRTFSSGSVASNIDNRRQSFRKTIKCPICLDEETAFQISGRQLVSTNCGHLFCDRCIKEVIKTSKTCPNCRKKISTQKSFHPIYI